MRVVAIQRGVGGMRLVEIAKEVVGEVWQRLGSGHDVLCTGKVQVTA